MVFKYKVLLIQEEISRNNNDNAKKIYNSKYFSFQDYYCEPKLLNQLAFLLYELNEIQDCEVIIKKGWSLALSQNSNKEMIIIMKMNYCLLRYIQGDYSSCKIIINDLNFDLNAKYEIITDTLYEMVVKKYLFF